MAGERSGKPDPAAGQALVDQLAREISTRIMDGEIRVGTWLRQDNLAAEFGVSRTPIREALRQLQAGGLVEVLPRRGALVRGPTARDIREAYVVRSELEGLAAELAVPLITDEQLDRLREAETLFRSAVENFTSSAKPPKKRSRARSAWPEANDLFHEVILDAGGNRRLQEAVKHLHLSFPRNLTWTALASNSRLLQANIEEHARIREALESHDAVAARQAMCDHIRRAGELIAKRVEISADGDGRSA